MVQLTFKYDATNLNVMFTPALRSSQVNEHGRELLHSTTTEFHQQLYYRATPSLIVSMCDS